MRENTYGNVCADPTGNEILGRDIGPQATNSYDDIDSYTESFGDVHPAISLPADAARAHTRTHAHTHTLIHTPPHFRMSDWIHDSAVEASRSFVPFPRRELGTSDTRPLRAEISSRPLT